MTEPLNSDHNLPRDGSRRGFIRGSSLLLAGALPPASIASVAENSSQNSSIKPQRELKVGLIGCGYQALATASELFAAANSGRSGQDSLVRLTALADAFPDRLQQSLRTLRGRFGDQIQVDGRSRFVGLHAYQDLLATDVDFVILAAPTVFRPLHFEQAVAAGKHIYAESPVAVDGAGVERFLQAGAGAQHRMVAIGLSHRHNPQYQQMIERLQSGAIGKFQSLQLLHCPRVTKKISGTNSQSEFDSQLRDWSNHPWASGGPVMEQWAEGLDLANWLLHGHPLEARCSPGLPAESSAAAPRRQEIPLPVEFTYAGGIKLQCHSQTGHSQTGFRQPSKRYGLKVQGAAGWCDLAAGAIFDAKEQLIWRAGDRGDDAIRNSHWTRFLSALASAEDGNPSGLNWNQTKVAVESTLTALLGRMAAHSQDRVTWDECSQSREVFDCINPSKSDLGVDRNATIERYLAGWNK